ncbi:hypothetical protein HDK90DRAFT_15316 [Phyllosticta capitalensis]|uniref:XPG-I domain-containing protein n=1 Tax=Phyllosticta capitalensis TaxID=121624 RepID=A0ABR1Z343_9PEZI
MGITGIWDIIGEGEVTEIAQLASNHFRRTGRPLRIAVDEAGWRFHNLNEHQVKEIIRENPGANPVERLLFFRITKILKLNIQLLFIFDGPRRPWKRGGPAGRVDYSKINVLRKLLDRLRVPHHRAPGEAEAECARLQQMGIVDAVWSEDSDTLMFGCTLLFRTHKVDKDGNRKGQKKDESRVRVYRAQEILDKYQLDREGMVLFAMMAGGDYNRQGLKGCGPTLALRAVKKGYGKMLCNTPQSRLSHFRFELLNFLKNKDVEVPADWPRPLHFQHYNEPVTSSSEELRSLRGLRHGRGVEIDQEKLRQFLIEEVQLSTKDFLRHVCPVLLVRQLCRGRPVGSHVDTPRVPFNVEFVGSRKKVEADSSEGRLERKIRFLPHDLVSFDLTVRPEEEDWEKLATKANGEFNPLAKIECEILDTILRHGLPASVFETPSSPPKRNRRRTDGRSEEGLNGESARTAEAPRGYPIARGPSPCRDTEASRKRKTRHPEEGHQPAARRRLDTDLPVGRVSSFDGAEDCQTPTIPTARNPRAPRPRAPKSYNNADIIRAAMRSNPAAGVTGSMPASVPARPRASEPVFTPETPAVQERPQTTAPTTQRPRPTKTFNNSNTVRAAISNNPTAGSTNSTSASAPRSRPRAAGFINPFANSPPRTTSRRRVLDILELSSESDSGSEDDLFVSRGSNPTRPLASTSPGLLTDVPPPALDAPRPRQNESLGAARRRAPSTSTDDHRFAMELQGQLDAEWMAEPTSPAYRTPPAADGAVASFNQLAERRSSPLAEQMDAASPDPQPAEALSARDAVRAHWARYGDVGSSRNDAARLQATRRKSPPSSGANLVEIECIDLTSD